MGLMGSIMDEDIRKLRVDIRPQDLDTNYSHPQDLDTNYTRPQDLDTNYTRPQDWILNCTRPQDLNTRLYTSSRLEYKIIIVLRTWILDYIRS